MLYLTCNINDIYHVMLHVTCPECYISSNIALILCLKGLILEIEKKNTVQYNLTEH